MLLTLQKKPLEMAYVAAGGVIQEPDPKKTLEAAYVAAGGKISHAENETLKASPHVTATGEIKQGDNGVVSDGKRKLVSEVVKDHLTDCKDRQGKSGYGLATANVRLTCAASCFV